MMRPFDDGPDVSLDTAVKLSALVSVLFGAFAFLPGVKQWRHARVLQRHKALSTEAFKEELIQNKANADGVVRLELGQERILERLVSLAESTNTSLHELSESVSELRREMIGYAEKVGEVRGALRRENER